MVVEIKNPKNVTQTAQVNLHYETVIRPGRSHMSNGDVGYPDEYIEHLVSWDCVGEQPEWLKDWIVRLQVDTWL